MKAVRRERDAEQADVRRQCVVDGVADHARLELPRQVEVRDLAVGVDPRVRPPCPLDLHGRAREAPERPLQHSLHRAGHVRLPLPAVELRPDVCDSCAIARHQIDEVYVVERLVTSLAANRRPAAAPR